MKQTPPRTHKEALQDMGEKLRALRGLANNLAAHELPALLQALPAVSPEAARLLKAVEATVAAMLSDLAELEALRREPFKAMA